MTLIIRDILKLVWHRHSCLCILLKSRSTGKSACATRFLERTPDLARGHLSLINLELRIALSEPDYPKHSRGRLHPNKPKPGTPGLWATILFYPILWIPGSGFPRNGPKRFKPFIPKPSLKRS